MKRPDPQKLVIHKKQVQRIVALAVAALLIGIALWVGGLLRTGIRDPETLSARFRALGFRGMLMFTGLCALQVVVAVLPAGPLELAGGYAFGTWVGSGLCLLGCAAGSFAVFLLVRLLGMPFVRLFISEKKLSSIRFLLDSPRWKRLMILCFLIPGAPKDVIAYVAGLTDIRPLLWLLVVSLGRLPSVLLTVFVGATAEEERYVTAALVLAGLLLLFAAGYVAFRRFSRKHNENDESNDN